MKTKKIISLSLSAALLAMTGCSNNGEATASASPASDTTKVTPGAVVTADRNSPTGYSVTFAYDGNDSDKTIETISVTGPFQYVDPDQEVDAEGNQYTPDEYENGMYATNYAPAGGMESGWGYTKEMTDEDGDGIYTTSFPISSGSFAYGYVIQYEGEEEPVNVDDPANPSPAKNNPDSITETGDIVHSIVYGKWDAEKQSDSLNLDYVLPVEEGAGEQTYVSYTGSDGETQYLCPPTGISEKAQKEAQDFALRFYHAVGARDMLRVDVIVSDKDDSVWVLEGNGLPGCTPSSLLPKAAQTAGIAFPEMCSRLARAAAER